MSPVSAFPAEYPKCPRCNELLRRVSGAHGAFWRTCEASVRDNRPGGNYGKSTRCGQTVLVITFHGVSFVSSIPKAVWEKHKDRYPGARMIYSAAGIIDEPAVSRDELPRYPCEHCHVPTAVDSLAFGVCRTCHNRELEDQLDKSA